MKKSILCTLLLLGSLLLSGCAAEPAETVPPTETLPSVPERPVLRDVKFVSGTTFSGALRPLVFPEKTAEYEVLAMPVLLIETEDGALAGCLSLSRVSISKKTGNVYRKCLNKRT